VKRLRTLSTRRLIVLLVALAVVVVAASVLAVAASGGGGPTPAPKPLAEAIHDGLAAPEPAGITARIAFTNNLFPSGALLGSAGSALMSGASGRLWLTNDGRGRIELQSNAGDAQIVWNTKQVTVYDASSNTAYHLNLPAQKPDPGAEQQKTPPTVAAIEDFLTHLREHANVSSAEPSDVAGQAAYTVRVSPKHDGGLLGAGELAWDAAQGVPLRVAIYAQGDSTPVLQLKATDISYGAVDAANVDVSPPAGAKNVDLTPPSGKEGGAGAAADISGLDAVRAAVDFPVAAPDTLVGLPRQTVTAVGGDSKGALIVYGQSLGAIVVFEQKADATSQQPGGPLAALPKISLDGITAHELSTQLGTAIAWDRDGVAYVLAGSMPSAAAEAAARALK
jgi:outer membrane lipoprotein-sorting protein